MLDNSYSAVMARKNEIMKRAVGMDYDNGEVLFAGLGVGAGDEEYTQQNGDNGHHGDQCDNDFFVHDKSS